MAIALGKGVAERWLLICGAEAALGLKALAGAAQGLEAADGGC
jgi:hypothetical protein